MTEYVNFNPEELETPIYRIISIERLFELFNNNENVLVSPSLWEDPFENFLSKTKITIDKKNMFFNERKWGQCWTTRIKETDAMWRIYSPLKDGVKIKTNVNKLVDSLTSSKQFNRLSDEVESWNNSIDSDTEPNVSASVMCGSIRYLPVKRIISNSFLRDIIEDKKDDILFIKRLEFAHEKEFRVVLEHFNPELTWSGVEESIFSYDFNFNHMIDELVFDPRMPYSLYNAYKEYLLKQGFRGEMKKSNLYSLPKQRFDL